MEGTKSSSSKLESVEHLHKHLQVNDSSFYPRLAIVGSRNFENYSHLKEVMTDFNSQYGFPSTIVSGGAKGADKLAERYAKENNIPIIVFRPIWSKYGRGAGIIRNRDIVKQSTHMVAFCIDHSKGTMNSINLAKEKGIHVVKVHL